MSSISFSIRTAVVETMPEGITLSAVRCDSNLPIVFGYMLNIANSLLHCLKQCQDYWTGLTKHAGSYSMPVCVGVCSDTAASVDRGTLCFGRNNGLWLLQFLSLRQKRCQFCSSAEVELDAVRSVVAYGSV